jgi:protein-S-isoprenylcysteine O-methyltransferase Ste14
MSRLSLLPSTVSRSTPRVRLMTFAILAVVVLVAVSARPLLAGTWSAVAAAIGFVLVVVAALGRAWTSLFIAGFKDAQLVRTGPYATCRHPLYALSLLGMTGLGLASRSVTLLVALVALAWVLHRRAIAVEDALLEATHGEAARDYRASVPALLPRWSRYAVPASLEIRPPVAWKAFLDAATLLLAFALVDLAHVLQVAGVTPSLLRLW